MDLLKYKNTEHIEVALLLPTTHSSTVGERDGKQQTIQESNYDNYIEGKVIDASKDSLTIEETYRSRVYQYEVPFHAIAFILKSELSENGKIASERMKQLHKTPPPSKVAAEAK